MVTSSTPALQQRDIPPVVPAEKAWTLLTSIENPDLAEPSSLCFVPSRNCVLAVDDGDAPSGRPAALLELDMHGATLQMTALGNDLEGVCYCESNSLIYVADEYKDTIHVVEPDGLKAIGSFRLDGKVGDERVFKASGNGIEGIEFLPAGAGRDFDRLIFLNQEKPHILLELPLASVYPQIPVDKVQPSAYWKYHPFNAGELHYDVVARELWLVHSWINMAEILDPVTMEPQYNRAIPGFAQEGLTIDSEGRLWIGQDTGGILIYEPALEANATPAESG